MIGTMGLSLYSGKYSPEYREESCPLKEDANRTINGFKVVKTTFTPIE